MIGLAQCLVGCVFFTLGPVPPDTAPNPTGKGYMGIRFTDLNESLGIASVETGLPADKAGIRAGDVIVRVGKLTPRSNQEVIDHVTRHRPGATLDIQVRRGTETKTFQLKLAERPPEPRQIIIEP